MPERTFELSRRKILGAAGAIGIAGAGAGLGTSALFSDEESFENNSITAGTLDMSVDAEIVEASDYWEDQGIIGESATAQGDPVVGLQAEDVKPGDWVIICFDITVEDNPGYVRVSADDFKQYENGYTEPEGDVASEDSEQSSRSGSSFPVVKPGDADYPSGQGFGELQDELVAEVYETYDDTIDGSGTTTKDSPRDYLSNENPSLSGSAKDAFEQFATGVVLGGSADPLEVDESVKRYLLLELPATVGNEVQSDAIEFDLIFDALQVRNNDGYDPSSDLVGYWPLNNVATAPVEDLSGNGNDGTNNGGVSATSGKVAGAGSFDGSDDYIAASGAYASTPVSIAAWFRVDGLGTLNPRIVGTNDSSFRLLLDGGYKDGDYSISFDVLNGGPSTDSPSGVDDGSWHHAAATYDGSTARLYLDGSEVDSASSSVTINNSDLWIGSKNNGTDLFEGAIDDVRIYDRALSSSEVSTLYNDTNL